MRQNETIQVFWRRRMTRRDILRAGGVAFGAAVIGGNMIGCDSGNEPTGPTATSGAGASPTPSGPKRGGKLFLSVPGQMTDLNPQPAAAQNSSGILMALGSDHLFNYDYINGRAELSLAASMEQPDHLTLIFKIKPNAKFQNLPPVNGRNVTSEDVVASWNSFNDNPRLTGKEIFTVYTDHYETPDPQTFIIKMKQPWAYAISTQGFSAPHPTQVLAKELIDQKILEKVFVGAGGYMVDQFDPASVLSLKRRPDGWHNGPDRPYIDEITYRVISDAAARSAALKAKQIDALLARDKLEADEFKSYGPDMNIIKERTHPPILLLRSDEQGLFKDVRVREAVYNALDVKDLIDRVEMGEGEYASPVHNMLESWALPQDELKKYFPYNLQKAKELMSAANWDSSKEIEFKYPSGEKAQLLCETLQKQLAAIGIKTRLVPQDTQTVWVPETYRKKDFQITAAARIYTGQSPDPLLKQYTTNGRGQGNDARWSDKEVDDIIDRQSQEFDFDKQRQMILDAQRLVLQKFTPIIKPYCPYVFTAQWGYYTDARFTQAYVGTYGGFSWIDTSNPGYPKDR